jgi:hypothetical protein
MRPTGESNLTVNPKRQVGLSSTTSRHRSVDGDWGFEVKHTRGFDIMMDLEDINKPHGQSPLPSS